MKLPEDSSSSPLPLISSQPSAAMMETVAFTSSMRDNTASMLSWHENKTNFIFCYNKPMV